jgi:hypothetical protein
MDRALHGLIAEFAEPDSLLAAAERAHAEGYRRLDAFSPFPIHGLSEALGMRHTRVPRVVLVCGILGAIAGFGLPFWISVVDYPMNVGARPDISWPSFVPIMFELTVLFAAFGAVVGMLLLNGLPRPHHPVFGAPNFERASQDGFFLLVEAVDPQFDEAKTKQFLAGLGASNVSEVEE